MRLLCDSLDHGYGSLTLKGNAGRLARLCHAACARLQTHGWPVPHCECPKRQKVAVLSWMHQKLKAGALLAGGAGGKRRISILTPPPPFMTRPSGQRLQR